MSEEWHTVAAARAREASQGRAERKARGVVHTPRAVAAWALSRVQQALTEDLSLTAGLGDARVSVLDPAVGTGVWLEAALAQAGGHCAPRTWLGFDVDAAALETARTLLADACSTRGITLELVQHNTLELASPWPDTGTVRVVLGNPPWATRSLSRGAPLSDAWLRDFMRDASGQPLAERRMGVLSDDYVRFFRWALEQARSATHGAVVCLATNSSFLDGPVHRGMRARLLEGFDRIEVLDLGGNALLSSAGERDENVFGVRVGAAITLLVRGPESKAGAGRTLVAFGKLLGARDHKLHALAHGHQGAEHAHVPGAPYYRFVPPARGHVDTHEGFSLAEAFPFHREGLQSNRDALAMASTRAELEARLAAVVRGEVELVRSPHFDPDHARAQLSRALSDAPEAAIAQIAYRPLVRRFACMVAPLCHRPRLELQQAMAHSSLALASVRKDRGRAPFHLFAPTRLLADSCFLSSRSSCRTRLFPSHTPEGEHNLAAPVRDGLGSRIGADVGAAEVLAYALAVLASQTYRARVGESLKHDYPRVPWPRDAQAFFAIAQAGRTLDAALHDDVAPLALSAPAGVHVRREQLTLEPSRGRVLVAGDVLLDNLDARAFSTQLGHYMAIESAFKVERVWSLTAVVQMLVRASRWALALAAAEHAFVTHAAL